MDCTNVNRLLNRYESVLSAQMTKSLGKSIINLYSNVACSVLGGIRTKNPRTKTPGHKPPDKNPLDKNPPCQKPPRQKPPRETYEHKIYFT